MKRQYLLKRVLGVILSIALVVGMITISEPNRVQASDTENLIANGGFETTEGWINNSDVSNPVEVSVQQTLQDKEVKEYIANGDFESGSADKWGSVHSLPSAIIEESGNKVLKISDVTNGKVFHVLSGLTAGETYQISFDIKGSSNISFHLFCGDEGLNNAVPFYTWQTATPTWTTHEMSYTVPAGNAGHLVFQCVGGSGEMYFDDFSVTQEKVRTDLTNVISNSDFESGSADKWGSVHSLPSAIVEESGNKVLKISDVTNGKVFHVLSGLSAGTTYQISFDIKGSSNVSFHLFCGDEGLSNAVPFYTWQTATPTWTTHEISYTVPAGNAGHLVFQCVGGSGEMYIDNFEAKTEQVAMTYTEGIGNCLGAEADNVLVMKNMTKVTYPATIQSGKTYEYSFAVKKDAEGSNFAVGFAAGENTIWNYDSTMENLSSWTTISGTFTATSDADSIQFTRGGVGNVFLDDVVLKEGEAAQVEPKMIDLGYKMVEVDNSWYFTSSDVGNITGSYYKATIEVDGASVEVPLEKTADGFVIWVNFFGIIDNSKQAPTTKLKIAEGTLIEQIDPNATGWSTPVEGGQTVKVAEELVVEKTDAGWVVQGGQTEPDGPEQDEPTEPVVVSLGNAMGLYNAGTENEVFSVMISGPEAMKSATVTATGTLTADGVSKEHVVFFPGNGEVFFYTDGATNTLLISKETEFTTQDGKTVIQFDKNYEIDLINQAIYEQGSKPVAKNTIDLTIAFDKIVNDSFMFTWELDSELKPEAGFYRADAVVDDEETQVLIEYFPGDDAFFIYPHCFNTVPVDGREGYPTESFELKEGTEFVPVASGTWVKDMEGQPYKLTSKVSVVKEGESWLDADYMEEISKQEPLEVKIVFDCVKGSAAIFKVVLPNGKEIDDIYGDWTTARGVILRGVAEADTGNYSYTSEIAAYSITGNMFYMDGLRLHELDALQIDAGTILYADVTCNSTQPIKITNQVRLIRDANDEWVIDKTFTTEYNLVAESETVSDNQNKADSSEEQKDVVSEQKEEIVAPAEDDKNYAAGNIQYYDVLDDEGTNSSIHTSNTPFIIIGITSSALLILLCTLLISANKKRKKIKEQGE